MKKGSFNYDELINCSNGELFGPGNARLPLPPMLMIDRITHISDKGGEYDKGEIIAELDIKKDAWFFDCHFFNDPVNLSHQSIVKVAQLFWALVQKT